MCGASVPARATAVGRLVEWFVIQLRIHFDAFLICAATPCATVRGANSVWLQERVAHLASVRESVWVVEPAASDAIRRPSETLAKETCSLPRENGKKTLKFFIK